MMRVVSQSDLLDKLNSLCKFLADYFLLLHTCVSFLALLIDSVPTQFIIQMGAFLRMKGAPHQRALGSEE